MPTDPKKNQTKQKRSDLKREEERKTSGKAAKNTNGKEKKGKKKKPEKPRRRVLPIWLRLIIVLALSALALLIGLMVGYGVIGEGQAIDALKWSTWEHIWDLVMETK